MAVELAEPLGGDPDDPSGDRFALFETLYRRYQPALVSTCTALMGSRAAGEDVAQETLLRAYQHLDWLDVQRAWPWLKTVASRLAIDDARKLGRIRPLDGDEPGLEDVSEGAPTDPTEERLLLEEALSRLPKRQRMAVALRYIVDYDIEEAAAFLHIEHSAFKQLLFRARRNLQAEYRVIASGVSGIALWPILVLRRARRAANTLKHGFVRSRLKTLLHPTLELGAALLVLGTLASNAPIGRASGPPGQGAFLGTSPVVASPHRLHTRHVASVWDWRSWRPATWGGPATVHGQRALAMCRVQGGGGRTGPGLAAAVPQTVDGLASGQVGSTAGSELGCGGSGNSSSLPASAAAGSLPVGMTLKSVFGKVQQATGGTTGPATSAARSALDEAPIPHSLRQEIDSLLGTLHGGGKSNASSSSGANSSSTSSSSGSSSSSNNTSSSS